MAVRHGVVFFETPCGDKLFCDQILTNMQTSLQTKNIRPFSSAIYFQDCTSKIAQSPRVSNSESPMIRTVVNELLSILVAWTAECPILSFTSPIVERNDTCIKAKMRNGMLQVIWQFS
jgi:hypothetical protein